MSVVVLDTDVASALLRRRAPDAVSSRLAGHIAAVTFVTVGELTKWTLIRHWGPRNLAVMRDFLSRLLVLPYDHLDRQASAGAPVRQSPATGAAATRGW